MVFLNTVSWLINSSLKPFVDNLFNSKEEGGYNCCCGKPSNLGKIFALTLQPVSSYFVRQPHIRRPMHLYMLTQFFPLHQNHSRRKQRYSSYMHFQWPLYLTLLGIPVGHCCDQQSVTAVNSSQTLLGIAIGHCCDQQSDTAGNSSRTLLGIAIGHCWEQQSDTAVISSRTLL